MSLGKPRVTIDLEEYNYLLNKVEEKDKELDYDEAYSTLISNFLAGRDIEYINKHFTKYEFIQFKNPILERPEFKVKLKKQND